MFRTSNASKRTVAFVFVSISQTFCGQLIFSHNPRAYNASEVRMRVDVLRTSHLVSRPVSLHWITLTFLRWPCPVAPSVLDAQEIDSCSRSPL